MSVESLPSEACASDSLRPLLVNERDARRLLGGLCAKTMYNLRRTGELPGVKIGSRIMYDADRKARSSSRQKGAGHE